MSQQLEIEFKNVLTKKEFDMIKQFFSLKDENFKKQHNYYFDTKYLALARNKCALRIREKASAYEMTLKQPQKIGLLETNEKITNREAEQWITNQQFPSSAETIKEIVQSLKVDVNDLTLLGQLTTNRAEVQFNGGLLVIDHSTYLNTEDYELEFEVDNEQTGMQIFYRLLNDLAIPKRQTKTKLERFLIKLEKNLS